MVMFPKLHRHNCIRWREDQHESPDGDTGHISYLSHLAWLIASYKQIGGDSRYDQLFLSLCATINRRLLADIALIGEVADLAIRTETPWK